MILTIDHGAVRELQLNRPPVNALSPELIAALKKAVELAPQDGARALVLSGMRGRFSAGLDIPMLLTLDRPAIADLWRELYTLLGALACSPIPITAAITGHATAGGTVLPIFCDGRIAAQGDWKLGLNEVQVGLPCRRVFPDWSAGSVRIRRILVLVGSPIAPSSPPGSWAGRRGCSPYQGVSRALIEPQPGGTASVGIATASPRRAPELTHSNPSRALPFEAPRLSRNPGAPRHRRCLGFCLTALRPEKGVVVSPHAPLCGDRTADLRCGGDEAAAGESEFENSGESGSRIYKPQLQDVAQSASRQGGFDNLYCRCRGLIK